MPFEPFDDALDRARMRLAPFRREPNHWSKPLVGAALVHLLLIGSVMLITPPAPPILPDEPAVTLVFIDPAPAAPQQAEPNQEATEGQPAEAVAQPPPPLPAPDRPTVPPAEQPLVQPHPTTPTVEAAPPDRTEPLPLPPPSPPPAVRAAPPRIVTHPARQTTPPPAAPPAEPSRSQAAAAPAISPAWQQELAAWLAAHRQYPEEARRRRIEGTVAVRFTVDRSGQVVDATVARSSGSDLLDASVLTMLHDARLPPPPATMPDLVTISIGIRYELTR